MKLKDYAKTLNENILHICTDIKKIFNELETIRKNQAYTYELKDYISELRNCRKLIEQITLDKYEVKDTALNTVIIMPYRGMPQVFKDGKKVDMERVSDITFRWSVDEVPTIEIEKR